MQEATDKMNAIQAEIDQIDRDLQTTSQAEDRRELENRRRAKVQEKRDWNSKRSTRQIDANRHRRTQIKPKETRISEINRKREKLREEARPLRLEAERLRNTEIPAKQTAADNAETNYNNAVNNYNAIKAEYDAHPDNPANNPPDGTD